MTRAWFFAADRTIDGTADVDVLDDVLVRRRRVGGDPLERIEVDDDEVDLARAEALEVPLVAFAARQDPPVHARVQRLDPPVHDLGRARVALDRLDGDALGRERLAVPPLDRMLTPRAESARTKGTRPDLSETETRAARIGMRGAVAWP